MLYGDFAVTPGTMDLAGLAVNLLGADKVDLGNFATTVFLKDMSVEDARAFLELANEAYPKTKFKMRALRYSVRASMTCHDQWCVEVFGAPPEVVKVLTVAVRSNWTKDPAYRARQGSGAFLQGISEQDGWVLIEFWEDHYQPFVNYLNERLKEIKL